jgi:hypothetical protein
MHRLCCATGDLTQPLPPRPGPVEVLPAVLPQRCDGSEHLVLSRDPIKFGLVGVEVHLGPNGATGLARGSP